MGSKENNNFPQKIFARNRHAKLRMETDENPV
jgi:hypothetical protein